MKNYVQDDHTLPFTAGADIAAGAGVLVGSIVGVSMTAVASGADGVLALRGVYTLAKAAGTINPGALLYWDDSAKRATATAVGNRQLGFHAGQVANAGAAGADIQVLLSPSVAVTAA